MLRFFNGYILFPFLELLAKRNILAKVKALYQFEETSNSEQLEQQKQDLYELLKYCQESIPYYKDLFEKQNFDITQVKQDITYLHNLPVLTKEIVKNELHNLRVESSIHPRKTGGSTGQSVWFFYDNEGIDWTAAINLFAYESVGKRRHHIDCHFSSEIGLKPSKLIDKIKNFLKLFSQNRKVLYFANFSKKDLGIAYRNLKSFKPFLVQGHPSSMYALATHIEENDIKIRSLCKIFEPSGEMLTAKMVAKIEKYIGCKVVNRYGNAEFGVVAHSRMQDNFTKLKIYRKAFYVEENDNTNLIITGLTNYGMPLLRYDTGDIATVKEESEGCFIYDIQGRIHDCVKIDQTDYPTHFIMDFLDHKVGRINEFQIVVEKDKLPILKIVPEDTTDFERIKNSVLTKWPAGLDVEAIKFENLHKAGWRQKFRHVIHLETSNG